MTDAYAVLEDHILAGRLDPAEAMAHHLLDANSEDAAAHVALARVSASRGQVDNAIRRLEQLLASNPRLPDALAHLAVLWRQKGDGERALLLGRRALSLGANVPQNDAMLADDALARAEFRQALELYDRALTVNGRLTIAWLGRGKVLRALGELADAEDALARAVELGPLKVESWIQLILVEREGGALEAAADNLALALRAHPGHPELLALKHDDDARRAIVDDPFGRALKALRAVAYDDTRGADAIAFLAELTEAFPSEPRIPLAQGDVAIYTGHGDVPQIVNGLNRLVRERQIAWEPRTTLGRLLMRVSPVQNVRMGMAHCEEAWRTSGEHIRAGLYLMEAYLTVEKFVHAWALAWKLAARDEPEAVRIRLHMTRFQASLEPKVESIQPLTIVPTPGPAAADDANAPVADDGLLGDAPPTELADGTSPADAPSMDGAGTT